MYRSNTQSPFHPLNVLSLCVYFLYIASLMCLCVLNHYHQLNPKHWILMWHSQTTLSTRGRLKDVKRMSSITNMTSIRRHLLGVEDITWTLNATFLRPHNLSFASNWRNFGWQNYQTFDIKMTNYLYTLILYLEQRLIYSLCT